MAEGFFEFRERLTRRAEAVVSPAPAAQRAGDKERPLTISQLTRLIDRALREQLPQSILVKGEVSNFNAHNSSGHVYFTLKDAGACIDCVMFRSDAQRMKFTPADGMELLAGGQVKVYAQRGRYQLYVSRLHPIGQGALELAFQQMRTRLEREGLFEASRKKPIPAFPQRIVMLTAPQAAALQDMLKVLQRFGWLKLMLYPVPVQGAQASAQIAAAISEINRRAASIRPDVILLARGGGSLEDLWAFNEENVARAIAASVVPIVTGIGHEVDVSIADLVADYHAHTPTEAAQVVTSNWRGIEQEIDSIRLRLMRMVREQAEACRFRLEGVLRHEFFRRPGDIANIRRQGLDDRQVRLLSAMKNRLWDSRRRLAEIEERLAAYSPHEVGARLNQRLMDLHGALHRAVARQMRRSIDRLAGAGTRLASRHPRHAWQLSAQRLGHATRRLDADLRLALDRRRADLDAMERALRALNPSAVLLRGYSMTLLKDGTLVRSRSQIKGGEKILTRLADGTFESIAKDPNQGELF